VLIQFVNKEVLVREPVLQDTLIFLVEAHLKLVLSDSSKISYCKINFYIVCIELYRIGMEVKTTLDVKLGVLLKVLGM